MTFNKCSVRGTLYGYVYDEAGNEIQDVEVKRKRKRKPKRFVFRLLEIKTDSFRRKRR